MKLRKDHAICLGVIIIIALVLSVPILGTHQHKLNSASFENVLANQNIQVISARIDSPSAIITVDNRSRFLSVINEFNIQTVYRESRGLTATDYYLLTEGNTIAYKFELTGGK